MMQYDVLMPYYDKENDHRDLEIALASLRKFAVGLRCVWLVSGNKTINPDLVKDINFIYGNDIYDSCKDGNLIRKTIIGLDAGAGRLSFNSKIPVVWMSDDNALLKPTNMAELPRVRNPRPGSDFSLNDSSKWRRRMANTFTELKKLNKEPKCNFDAHCPQCFDKDALYDAMIHAPRDRNVCIHTWSVGYIYGEKAHERTINQEDVKITFENNNDFKGDLSKFTFLGWNDSGRDKAHEVFKKIYSGV